MHVRGGYSAVYSDDVFPTFLETEPAIASAYVNPLPFRLVGPMATNLTPRDIPPIVVSAVRVRTIAKKFSNVRADVLKVAPIPISIQNVLGSQGSKNLTTKAPVNLKRKSISLNDINGPSAPYNMVAPCRDHSTLSTVAIADYSELQTRDGYRESKKPRRSGSKRKAGGHSKKASVTSNAQNSHQKTQAERPSKSVRKDKTDNSKSVGRSIGHWHHGMYSCNGINYVDALNAPRSDPPPPVISTNPERWTAQELTIHDIPTFTNECQVRSCIQYLHYLATSLGRLPKYPAHLQQKFNVEQKIFRDRLRRVYFARDGRHVEGRHLEKVRYSSRTKSMSNASTPQKYTFSVDYPNLGLIPGMKNDLDEVSEVPNDFDPAELTDVRLGDDYQAIIPEKLPKLEELSEREKTFEGTLILKAQDSEYLSKCDNQPSWRDCTRDERTDAIAKATGKLMESLGPEVSRALGVSTMGAQLAQQLDEELQNLLLEGMMEHGRDFYVISKDYCKGIAPSLLASYYYDVWKLRAIPAAKTFYTRRAALAAAEVAEAEIAQMQKQEESARRALRQEAAARRRQVKEAIQWIRTAGRLPAIVNYNKPVVRERANRAVKALRHKVEW